MLKIAVCDDEEQFRKIVGKYIEVFLTKQFIDFHIDYFQSGVEFAGLEEEMSQYDVAFLDISMDKLDGIEVAKRLRKYSDKVIIVFITAFLDYSLEGYKVNAIRYLLKSSPNLKLDFDECMETVLDKINYTTPKKNFRFREVEKEVELNNIVYIESRLHMLEFHISENNEEIYTMYGILAKLEEEIKGYGFIRAHQSYLVNLRYVKEAKKRKLSIKDGRVLEVPRARWKDVEKAVTSYKGEA